MPFNDIHCIHVRKSVVAALFLHRPGTPANKKAGNNVGASGAAMDSDDGSSQPLSKKARLKKAMANLDSVGKGGWKTVNLNDALMSAGGKGALSGLFSFEEMDADEFFAGGNLVSAAERSQSDKTSKKARAASARGAPCGNARV